MGFVDEISGIHQLRLVLYDTYSTLKVDGATPISLGFSWLQNHLQVFMVFHHMGVSLNGGFPPISHPKCWSFLAGKPHGFVGDFPSILGFTPICIYAFNPNTSLKGSSRSSSMPSGKRPRLRTRIRWRTSEVLDQWGKNDGAKIWENYGQNNPETNI